MNTSLRLFGIAALSALVLAGCKKKEPVEMPTPAPASVPAPPPPPPPPPPPARTEDPNVAIERRRAELINTIAQRIHFDFDRADIRSMDQSTLDQKATILSQHPEVRIRISGHADERGSDEYNLVLGNRRAQAAKSYLERQGVATGRIDIISYGEERPVDPSSNESAWAQNRRAEFDVIAGRESLGRPR